MNKEDNLCDWNDFGIRLKNARNSIGMTIEKLAENINRTDNFVSRIENGKRCSVATLCSFCKVLDISSDYLLFGNNEQLKVKDYSDTEIINNILSKCNEKQLNTIKTILIALYPDF